MGHKNSQDGFENNESISDEKAQENYQLSKRHRFLTYVRVVCCRWFYPEVVGSGLGDYLDVVKRHVDLTSSAVLCDVYRCIIFLLFAKWIAMCSGCIFRA